MSDTPLAQFLRLCRENNEYKQDDLASYLGITRQTYSHYETARLLPPTETLYKLSLFYNIPVSKLVKLEVMSSAGEGNSSDDIMSLIKENDPQSEFDLLYNEFLKECSDMSPEKLKKWMTTDDKEMIFYFHRLGKRDKRIITNLLKNMVINK